MFQLAKGMSTMDLQDKRALITGGTSGMGSAVALSMAEKGASVIITGRDETRGASTVEEIRAGGHDAQFIAADFSEMSEVRRVADAAGEIDVLVNLAGVAVRASTADTDEPARCGGPDSSAAGATKRKRIGLRDVATARGTGSLQSTAASF